jgi:hypothetical protein
LACRVIALRAACSTCCRAQQMCRVCGGSCCSCCELSVSAMLALCGWCRMQPGALLICSAPSSPSVERCLHHARNATPPQLSVVVGRVRKCEACASASEQECGVARVLCCTTVRQGQVAAIALQPSSSRVSIMYLRRASASVIACTKLCVVILSRAAVWASSCDSAVW